MLGAFDSIQKKLISYLLKRSIGPYVKNFNVDQFSLGLSSGTGGLKNVDVNCEIVNLLLEEENVPLEIVEGEAKSISVTVPWFKILKESCQVTVEGLYLHVQPKKGRMSDGKPPEDSMLPSLSLAPSIVAEEFKATELPKDIDMDEAMPAIRSVEETIESVLFNVKFELKDTVIRFESQDDFGLGFGTAIEVHIDSLKILPESSESEGSYQIGSSSFLNKRILLEGLRIHLDIYKKSPFHSFKSEKCQEEEKPIVLAELKGVQECHMQFKLDETQEGPKVQLDLHIETLLMLLTPMQLQILKLIYQDFSDQSVGPHNQRSQIQPQFPYQGWTSSVDSFEKYLSMVGSKQNPRKDDASFGNQTHLNVPESDAFPTASEGENLQNEDSLDSLQFLDAKLQVNFKTIVIVLLHQDILALNSQRKINSVQDMQIYADHWFDGFDVKSDKISHLDLSQINSILDLSSLGKSHLRVTSSDVYLESNVSLGSNGFLIEGLVSSGHLEFDEFLAQKNLPSNSLKRSALNKIFCLPGSDSKLVFTMRKSSEDSLKANVRVEIGTATGEVDISIMDRLHLILNPQIISNRIGNSNNESLKVRTKLSIEINLQNLDLNLRIPAPNVHNTYWVQDLLEDSVTISCGNVLFKTKIDSEVDDFKAELNLMETKLSYKPNQDLDSLLLATVNSTLSSKNCIKLAFHPQKLDLKGQVTCIKNFGERVILDGDEDFLKMMTDSCKNSEVKIACELGAIQVNIVSKEMLESIGRAMESFSSWGPQTTTRSLNFEHKNSLHPSISHGNTLSSQYDSDNEEFYSVIGGEVASTIFPASFETRKKSSPSSQTKLVVDVQIYETTFILLTPFKNFRSELVPGSHGQITGAAKNVHFFFILNYNGNSNRDYACLRSEEISVFHCGHLQDEAFLAPEDPRMKQILSRSHTDAIPSFDVSSAKVMNKSNAMMALAIVLERDDENQTMNTKVHFGLQNATFHHFMTLPNQDCFSQLEGFVGTKETDSSLPLNSIHVNLSNISITYAPIHAQPAARLLFILEQTSILLYMDVTNRTTILHLVIQDAGLHLTNKNDSFSVMNDYIQLFDMDLFKLVVKICNHETEGQGIDVEVGSGNSIWNLTACSDSLKMLSDIFAYFANDGDLVETQDYDSFQAFLNQENSRLLNNAAPVVVPLEDNDFSSEIFRHDLNDAMQSMSKSTIIPSLNGREAEVVFEEGPRFPSGPSVLQQSADKTSKPGLYPSLTSMNDQINALIESTMDLSSNIELTEEPSSIGESFVFVDNYFDETNSSKLRTDRKDVFKTPENFPVPVVRFVLDNISLNVSLYGGDGLTKLGKDVKEEIVAAAETPLGESPCQGISSRSKCDKLGKANTSRGRLDNQVLVEFLVEKLKFQHEVYPEKTKQSSRQVLTIHRFEVLDKVKKSRFQKVIYLDMTPEAIKQEDPYMVMITADQVRPEETVSVEECFLKIQLKPLRITVDQETLTFLMQFVDQIFRPCGTSATPGKRNDILRQNIQVTYNVNSENISEVELPDATSEVSAIVVAEKPPQRRKLPGIYFREIIFSPDVPIRLDYKGKLTFDQVSTSMNWLVTLLMGVGQLDNAQVKLVALKNDRGVLGIENMIRYLTNEWTNDISKHQLPSILKGVDIFLPANSFVQLYQGAKDLFVLPAEQYKKDGNLIYGLQLGLTSFSSSTLDALLNLTNRLVHAVQATAEVTYDIVSSGQSIEQERQNLALRSHPSGIIDGFTNACTTIVDGVGGTATNFVAAASAGRASKGIPGAIGGVLREIPPAVVKPVIIAAEVTSNVIEGVKAQIHPNLKREVDEKLKK